MGKALLVAAIVLGVCVVLGVLIVVVKSLVEGPAVRRRELKQTADWLRVADQALRSVDVAAQRWLALDPESPLAHEVREHVEKYRSEAWRKPTS